MRLVLMAAILAGACGAAYAGAPFIIDSFDIEVGQPKIGDVVVFPDGNRVIVLSYDGLPRLRMIDADKRALIDTREGQFEHVILANSGAVVGRNLFLACWYGLLAIDLETKDLTEIYVPPPIKGADAATPMVLSSTKARAYVIAANELLAVDTGKRTILAHLPIEGERLYELAISHDDQILYVADGATGLLSRFDAKDLSLLGSSAFAESGFENRRPGMAVEPGGSVYVGYSNLASNYSVSVLNRDGALLTTKTYDWGADGLAMTPDGAYLITGNGEVIIRKSLQLLGRFRTGHSGSHPQVTPDGRRAFIAHGEQTLTVADLTSIPRLVRIDVRPEGVDVPSERKDDPLIPVVILSDPDFDARTVLPNSVCFGNWQEESLRSCGEAKVIHPSHGLDGDGLVDLLLSFHEASTGIDLGHPEACLTGKTHTSKRIASCGPIHWPESQFGPGTGAVIKSDPSRTPEK